MLDETPGKGFQRKPKAGHLSFNVVSLSLSSSFLDQRSKLLEAWQPFCTHILKTEQNKEFTVFLKTVFHSAEPWTADLYIMQSWG